MDCPVAGVEQKEQTVEGDVMRLRGGCPGVRLSLRSSSPRRNAG